MSKPDFYIAPDGTWSFTDCGLDGYTVEGLQFVIGSSYTAEGFADVSREGVASTRPICAGTMILSLLRTAKDGAVRVTINIDNRDLLREIAGLVAKKVQGTFGS